MSLDLRRLRYFVATAEELHFGRAAERLGIAQPPLSLQIQALERDLGTALLIRDRRKVALTEAGRVLLDEARKLLAQAELARALTVQEARGERGRLAIGFITPVAYGFLPSLIRRFRDERPGIALQLHEMVTDLQLDAIKSEALDVGFLTGPIRDPHIACIRLSDEPLIAAIPEGHAFAGARTPLPATALRDQDIVLFPRRIAAVLYDQLIVWCARHGVHLRIVQEAPQSQTIVSLVSAGLGIAILPRSIGHLQRPGVVYRALRPATPRAQYYAAWLARRSSPAIDHFVAMSKRTTGLASPAGLR